VSGYSSSVDVLCRACVITGTPEVWHSGASVAMDEPASCWLIASGSIDLFCTAPIEAGMENSEQSAKTRRHHLMRMAAGDVLFGFEIADGMMAVPSETCEVFPLTASMLFNEAACGADRHVLTLCIDTWFKKLAEAVHLDAKPRKSTLLLGDEKQLRIEKNTALQAMEQTVWVAGQNMLLNGQELVADTLFPVISPAWLLASDDMNIDVLHTHDVLEGRNIQPFFGAAQAIYMCMFISKIHAGQQRTIQGIEQRETLQKHKVVKAVHALAAVVGQDVKILDNLSSIPLVAACQYVADGMNISIKTPAGGAESLENTKDPVGLISRLSGFRTRLVKLSGTWWQQEQGSLLVFRREGMQPCALLADDNGEYQLLDPQQQSIVQVDKDIAAGLADYAMMFYSPLPQGLMRIMDLFSMSLKGRSKDGWSIAAMVLLTGVLSMAMPLVTEQVMAVVIPEAQYGQLWIFGIALIAIAVSSTVFSLVQSVAVLRVEGMMDNHLQSAVWDKLLRLPSTFFRNFTVGDLTNRAAGVDAMRQLFTSSAVASLLAAVTGLFSLILMFYYDVRLASVVVVLSISMAAFTFVMGRKAVAKNREYLERRGDVMTDVLQYLNAMAKLRVCGVESDAFSLWAKKYAGAEDINMQQKSKMNAVTVANTTFTFVAMASILFVLALQGGQVLAFFNTPKSWQDIDAATLTHVMSVAAFIAFNAAYGQFSSAIGQLANQGIALSMIKPLYDRLRPILDADEESHSASIDPGELSGSIEIKDVFFRYCKDAPLVLRGLSMQVNAGEFVALVGPSGAGKSSLLRLLLAFDTPESGSVFLDGKDITQLETQALRRNFGVVLQNGQLFAGSVFDNITAGSNLSMDDAWWASRMAGFDKDIESMPMGMHTVLSEGAGTLSGGQRQRLMIARAIINRPGILIFDEATSALDNETQAIVSRSLETLNCTRIAIAHRLSTVRKADKIFVIDAGRVVESGSYDSLMEEKGVFYGLAQRQIA